MKRNRMMKYKKKEMREMMHWGIMSMKDIKKMSMVKKVKQKT